MNSRTLDTGNERFEKLSNEIDLQRKADEMVDRDVYANANWVIEALPHVLSGDAPDYLPFGEDEANEAWSMLQKCVVDVPKGVPADVSSGTWEGSPDAARELAEECEERADDREANAADFGGDPGESVCEALRDFARELERAADDPETREPYECWIVSRWLADRLSERGEAVMDCGYAGHYWLRCTTGQAISLDGVIREITRELHE